MGFRNPIGATDILTPGSVTSTILADGSVITPKIANTAVVTAKIADTAVTNPKVAPPVYQGLVVLANNVFDYGVSVDTAYQTVRVLQDINGRVWCEGILQTSVAYASGVAFAQLPVGFRPQRGHAFVTWAGDNYAGRIVLAANGVLSLYPAGGTWPANTQTYLSPVQFWLN